VSYEVDPVQTCGGCLWDIVLSSDGRWRLAFATDDDAYACPPNEGHFPRKGPA
jgi:hypothetical protein